MRRRREILGLLAEMPCAEPARHEEVLEFVERNDIAGTGLLVGEAERQGKIVVSTELGDGGHVTAAIHRLAASAAQIACTRASTSANKCGEADLSDMAAA